jgi:MoaA/NifB/PqqE/SkfB family radical SAM enzyme
MTPELDAQYAAAAIPFYSRNGGVDANNSKMKSWRYFLEINSACNLFCPTCTKGNQRPVEGLRYEHKSGLMDMEFMERALDKIKLENPGAYVLLYGNSEPMLHPNLPECVKSVISRNLTCEISTNLNVVHRIPELLDARPSVIIISLSGFTQDIYVRGHAGGDIEKVKENMRVVAEENNKRPERVAIVVHYHLYNDNEHELPLMREYATSLGIGMITSYARAISMENAIQYCRSKDSDATQFEVQEERPDWNKVLPPVGETYIKTMGRLKVPPTKAKEIYSSIPLSEVCPVGAGSIFTFIRHDGKTQLCACTADRRITLKDYLDTTPDELILERTGHSICKQCIKYRLNLYFMDSNQV